MEEPSKKIIIEVAPITKIPLARSQSFSYLAQKEITPGTLVSIPLFRRTVEGIVLSHKPDFARLGNIELKKISAVLEKSFLDAKQLVLADFIATYYFSPLGIVLKSFVPNRVKARLKKPDLKDSKEISQVGPLENSPKIILTEKQKQAIQTITTSNFKFQISRLDSRRQSLVDARRANFKFLLFGPAGAGKTEIYISAIKKICRTKQTLILLPELTLTPQALERYGKHFAAREIAVLTSKLTKGAYYEKWKAVRSGEVKIIIGTRMAVFAPFKDLGLIVVDEEQDISHKQWEMTPRYDARRVAEELARLHHCRIIFGSATPSLESYHQTLVGKAQLVEIPHLEIPGAAKKNYSGPQIEVVDMRKELWKTGGPYGKTINSSSLSRKLQSEIAYALKNKLQIILFINRQGMSTFSVCAACKNVLRCPQCEKALVYDKSGIYACSQCPYKTSITARCSKCGSIEFKNIGLGTQKIEREAQGLFPGARIARVDSQTMQNPGAQEKIYSDFSAQQIDILIGTQMITKGWDLPNVALIGIIDADNMLSVPDFSTNIRAFQNMVQVAGRSDRPHSKWRGMVIIQTFSPQLAIFKSICERDVRLFYTKELAEREALNLPPFGKIIKLLFQDYSREKVTAETSRLYAKLEAVLEAATASVSEPQESFVPNVRGRFRKQIIIKLKQKELPIAIKNILLALPSGWLIDVDPISVI